AAEQHGHDSDFILYAGLADVKCDLRIGPAHLPDNRLLDLPGGGKRQPASLAVSSHCFAQPPAIAGTMLTSSPSFTGVSRFFRNRMSSSLTSTLTNRFN